ncbi:hypothetical protein [Pseudomonas sp. OHS18]|uniref:hypothetical protein n=1 Tax=Pseudomonas sp. OHS18 TaxID=3399679 RepID=UPI003A84A0E6
MQDKLARFDREKRQQYHVERLQQMDKEASASCGTTLKTDIDWQAMDEQLLKELSVSGYCGEVVNQMNNLCSSSPSSRSRLPSSIPSSAASARK